MNHEHCEGVIWTLIGLWTLTWFSFCTLLSRVIQRPLSFRTLLSGIGSQEGAPSAKASEVTCPTCVDGSPSCDSPELDYCRRLLRLPFRSGGEYRAACETLLRIVDERGKALELSKVDLLATDQAMKIEGNELRTKLTEAGRRANEYAAALTETDSMRIEATTKLAEAEMHGAVCQASALQLKEKLAEAEKLAQAYHLQYDKLYIEGLEEANAAEKRAEAAETELAEVKKDLATKSNLLEMAMARGDSR